MGLIIDSTHYRHHTADPYVFSKVTRSRYSGMTHDQCNSSSIRMLEFNLEVQFR